MKYHLRAECQCPRTHPFSYGDFPYNQRSSISPTQWLNRFVNSIDCYDILKGSSQRRFGDVSYEVANIFDDGWKSDYADEAEVIVSLPETMMVGEVLHCVYTTALVLHHFGSPYTAPSLL